MKPIRIFLVGLALLWCMSIPTVFAQTTILPQAGTNGQTSDCQTEIDKFNRDGNFSNAIMSENEILGCAIMSGRISLAMIPYFIQYFSNFLLGLVSLVALLFVVIGGFLYTLGGLTEEKAKGKTFITNALIGMVIAFLSWTLVNVLISALTG